MWLSRRAHACDNTRMTTAAPDSPPPADGRRASRHRNLLAVVDAMLELFAEGNLDPGAQEVANRSGVSRRSVFRYFEDMEALGRAAIQRMHDRLEQYAVPSAPADAPLPERVAALAEQRVNLYSRGAPAARVMRVRAPFRPLMHEELDRNRKLLDTQVANYFQPELAAIDDAVRHEIAAALGVLYSFECFDALVVRGLDEQQITATLVRSATAILVSAHG